MISPEQLRRYSFFAGLTPEELSAIALISEPVQYADGAEIFHDGQSADRLMLLVSGSVDLVYQIRRNDGVEISYVGSIEKGEPFGLSAFVEPYRLTATCVAHGPIKVIAIDSAALRAQCELTCHMGYTLLRQIARAQAERLGFTRIQLAACNRRP
jgi:CRP-like cAMP-binding protein